MTLLPEFEWDPEKARLNQRKHGISFGEACSIWTDPLHFRVRVATDPEERWLVVGRVGRRRYLSAIVTYRGDDEGRLRIISARRSTKAEMERYHG